MSNVVLIYIAKMSYIRMFNSNNISQNYCNKLRAVTYIKKNKEVKKYNGNVMLAIF